MSRHRKPRLGDDSLPSRLAKHLAGTKG